MMTYRLQDPSPAITPDPAAAVPVEQAPADAAQVFDAMITDPVNVLTVLILVLALLFAFNKTALGTKVFKVAPLLLFCYFVPTALSNAGVIPIEGKFPLYQFIKTWMLPGSLMLLILSVDIPAIMGLGSKALILFVTAVVSIVIGGPIAFFALGGLFDAEVSDQAWRGLSALAGSWIGGGANMTAMQVSTQAPESIFGAIVVVDVAAANVWMAFLLLFAGRNKAMDAKIGADTSAVDAVQEKAEAYAAEHARPTDLPSLLAITAIAFVGTAIALQLSGLLPELPPVVSGFTWVVLLVTAFSLILSFTPLRHLEGAGASKVGSVFLYLLVASIGAKADFAQIFVKENLPLLAVGAVWITIHALCMLFVRRLIKAPIFFAAVGSKSCIGGAASAPIVAAAFNPALAPVGVILAIGGYVVGTPAAVACAALLEQVHQFYH